MSATPSPTPAASAPRRRRWPRVLAWLVALLALLVLLPLAFLLIAVHTEAGTRLLWNQFQHFAPGNLSGELVGGTLGDGLQLRNLVYQDQNKTVRVDELEGAWRLSHSPLKLTVQFLLVGQAEVQLLPSPPEPTTLPERITLPLELDVQEISVRQVQLTKDGNVTEYGDIRLRGNSDRIRHALDLVHAGTPYGATTASLKLHGIAPYSLEGNADLQGAYQDQPYQVEARVSGSLETMRVELRATGEHLAGSASIDATPLADIPFSRADINLDRLNPQAINPGWPHAALKAHALLSPTTSQPASAELEVSGPISINNAEPGPVDAGRVPVRSMTAEVTMNAARQQLSQLHIQLPGGGVLRGGGTMHSDGNGEVLLEADRVNLKGLHTASRPTSLRGPISFKLAGAQQSANLSLSDPTFSVEANATLTADRITLDAARLKAGDGLLTLRGDMSRGPDGAYAASGRLADFNPAQILAIAGNRKPAANTAQRKGLRFDASINMDFEAEGMMRPEPSMALRFAVQDSHYAGLPMTGAGKLHIVGKRVLPSDAQLSIAGNELLLKGSFGRPADRLQFDIDAPDLDRLGFGISGLLRASGTLAGSVERPVIDARYEAQELVFGEHRLTSLSGAANLQGIPGSSPDARIDVSVDARGARSGVFQLESLNARIDGTYARHAIRVDTDGRLRGQPLDLDVAAEGGIVSDSQGMGWDGTINTLENRGLPRVSMASPLTVRAGAGQLVLGSTRLTIAQALIDLKGLHYSDQLIRSEGSFGALNLSHLLALRQQFTGEPSPVSTDLVLDGSWNVTLAEQAKGFVRISRRSGDLGLAGATADSMLGLADLDLAANLQGDRVSLKIQAVAARIGTVTGAGHVLLERGAGRIALASDAPVSGRLAASIPRLQSIASLAGPKISLGGSVTIDLDLAGTLDAPRVSGNLAGERLALTLYDQGIRLRDGTARVRLENNVIDLQSVEFHGGDGTLRATGRIPLDRASTDMTATIIADNLQLLASPSGQMTVSGQAEAANVNQQLQLNGNFRVNRALFSLPEKTVPKLDDDVVVIRGPSATAGANQPGNRKTASPYTPRVNIAVDLGRNFRFQGSGADLRLAGTVYFDSTPGAEPRASGTVRVVEGSYEAFGTTLVIERGLLNFQGPVNNPNVNILAMRRGQEVAAGVLVTGTVQQPRVQLVSEPNVPDEEKLSWLIFGRSGGGAEAGQAQAAATGAALGLLNKFGGKRIAGSLGLDELSIGESEYGLAGQQVVNLGKELSDRLFIGFEQSLAGTGSVLKLTYELSRYWSVVVRGGAVTGLDVFYNRRFDSMNFR